MINPHIDRNIETAPHSLRILEDAGEITVDGEPY